MDLDRAREAPLELPDLLGDRDSQRPRFSVRDAVLVLIKADWGSNHDINGVVEVGARSCQRILPIDPLLRFEVFQNTSIIGR